MNGENGSFTCGREGAKVAASLRGIKRNKGKKESEKIVERGENTSGDQYSLFEISNSVSGCISAHQALQRV